MQEKAVRITRESGPLRGNSIVKVTYKKSPLDSNVKSFIVEILYSIWRWWWCDDDDDDNDNDNNNNNILYINFNEKHCDIFGPQLSGPQEDPDYQQNTVLTISILESVQLVKASYNW